MTTTDKALIARLVQEAITQHWGDRCATKDTEDFPELADQAGAGRCGCCEAWEEFDRLTAVLAENEALRAEVERRDATLRVAAAFLGKCDYQPGRDYAGIAVAAALSPARKGEA